MNSSRRRKENWERIKEIDKKGCDHRISLLHTCKTPWSHAVTVGHFEASTKCAQGAGAGTPSRVCLLHVCLTK